MIKKLFILFLMCLYVYTLTFDIFLNNYFKIPAPLVLGIPLIVLFNKKSSLPFLLGWETLFYLLANFFYYAVGQSDFKPFLVNVIVFVVCVLYFNYFVGENRKRFKVSVFLFYAFLALSAIIMFGDHYNPDRVDLIRSRLVGADQVLQSPSGICTSIFTFGYQLSALVSFVFIYSVASKKNILITAVVAICCILSIFYGMQRSVLISFGLVIVLFISFYYKLKAVPILSGILVAGFLFFTFILKPSSESGSNIFAKNNQNNENGENRSGLVKENLKIYSNYPFGLVFYGKQWKDVTQNNPTFSDGLTSHNAYLMFFTYLGPVLGTILIVLIYYNIFKIFKNLIRNIRTTDTLFLCLCFSFFGVSINALFHNAWLLNSNGPTIFLYVAVLHLSKVSERPVNGEFEKKKLITVAI